MTAIPAFPVGYQGVLADTPQLKALIDNVNNLTGNGTAGAITGTTGTFSGGISATTGTFSGAVSGTTGTFSGAVATGALTVTGALAVSGNASAAYALSSVGNALTAVGTNRATALQLAKQVNNVTTAGSGTGVILPVGVVGMVITIYNAGANAAQVYATASETIDTVAGATGVPLTNTKRAIFTFVAANTWVSAQLGVVSA